MRPAYSSFFVFYVNECTKAGNYGKLFHRNNERMYAHEKGYYKWKNNDYIIMNSLQNWYPTIGKASTEIINLQSILYLPKGTEHFLSDIHGEFKAFSHVLRNGSGAVRKKIDDVFGHTLSTADKMSLATLIYYPQKKIELVRQTEDDIENWYKITLYRLIEVCKTVSSKYTRSKVRKALRRIMRM